MPLRQSSGVWSNARIGAFGDSCPGKASMVKLQSALGETLSGEKMREIYKEQGSVERGFLFYLPLTIMVIRVTRGHF
jgi:transposase